MKKVLAALVGFLLLAATALEAQEDGAKLAKSAGKALTSYNIDPSGSAGKLDEAKQKIDQALQMPDAQAMPSAWLTKGDIYLKFVQKDQTMRAINPQAKQQYEGYAFQAYDAYQKAFDLGQKKYEKSDAAKGIAAVQADMVNDGVAAYSAGNFEKAFQSFNAALKAHEFLPANGQKSIWTEADAKNVDEISFYAGLSAFQYKNMEGAKTYFEKLYKTGNAIPGVYEGLYQLNLAIGDSIASIKYLKEGRAKHPDDSGLLFAEINTYLRAGKLNELVVSLQQAIAKEPDNVQLYTTLGNVFDNLYQMELKNKNDTKANEYIQQARNYYDQALAKDPNNTDALYSVGALYYNKAAILTQELNASEDYSAAGIRKMEVLKNEVMKLFDEALPYFQKAESANPNDLNTLIALSEIFARKEDDRALEFKKRIDVVRGGGKNEAPFFKK